MYVFRGPLDPLDSAAPALFYDYEGLSIVGERLKVVHRRVTAARSAWTPSKSGQSTCGGQRWCGIGMFGSFRRSLLHDQTYHSVPCSVSA